MQTLLENFSITEIIMFLFFLCVAVKEAVDFVDWIKEKVSNRDEKVQTSQETKKECASRIEKLEIGYDELSDVLIDLSANITLLLESDKDAIKAYITQEHHNLCYKQGWVDDYTLDCLERRYSHYVEENGNSFIKQLMNEIRALPKKPYDYKGE